MSGRRLCWLQSGHGAPIVLLHAFPLHAGMWQSQHDAVPHGWQLITPDLRGLGESSGPSALSVADHADDVLALMRHLGLESAVIGGLSLGGDVAFAVDRAAPQRFRAMVLANTRSEADTDEARANRVKMQQTARRQGPPAIADAMLPKLLGPAARNNQFIADRVRNMILDNDACGIIDALDALQSRPDSTPQLSRIGCPTLVMVGADDELTPPALSERMHAGVRGSTLAVIPDAGHLSNLENPACFNKALWAFVRQLDQPSAVQPQ